MDDTTAAIDAALSGALTGYAISQGQSVNSGGVSTISQTAVTSNSLLWLAAIALVGVFAFWSLVKG